MFFTRCPACQTTFRLSADTLRRAQGRVSCGRCGSVFNALESLYEQGPDGELAPVVQPPPLQAPEAVAMQEPMVDVEPAPLDAQPLQGAIEDTDQMSAQSSPEQTELEETDPGLTFDLPEDQWSRFFAEVQAESERAAQAALVEPQAGAPQADEEKERFEEEITLREPGEVSDEFNQAGEEAPRLEGAFEHGEPPGDEPVDRELDSSSEPPTDDEAGRAEETGAPFRDAPSFEIEHVEPAPAYRSAPRQPWGAGSLVLIAMLCLQGIHHFRASLAGVPVLGAWLQSGYGLMGVDVSPRWDIDQYETMDWVATAGAATDGQDSLHITARIHNSGPRPQPYPYVHLRLNDRWEAAVGSRIFRPPEYLSEVTDDELMAPGVTVPASLVVVDPGQDAYGFELDVCVELQDNVLNCAADKVFQ